MAEYYPLLSRAVAGLRDGAPEPREAIYARARQALVGQLRTMQPPIPEEAITKEITALDEAIGKIEAELKPRRSVSDLASAAIEAALLGDPPAAPVSADGASKPRPALPDEAVSVPAAAPGSEGSAPSGLKPPTNRPASPRAERLVFTPRPTLPPARAQRPTLASPQDGKPAETKAPAEQPAPAEPAAPSLPVAPTLGSVLTKDAEGDGAAPMLTAPAPQSGSDDAPAIQVRGRDDAVRPAMPHQPAPQARNLRVWIVAVAALAAVVAIALTAWKLRDDPEALARVQKPAALADNTPGKIVERADGSAPVEDEPQDTAQAAASPAQPSQPAPQAATPVPVPSAGTTAQPASEQTIPVSYKAAVLVAAPDTPEKVRTFVGTVVWRSEGSAQDPANLAVRADVDVPEAKLQMTMEIRKNNEAQFPASHTIDIKFTPGAGSAVGAVKQIDVPQMRREDAPTGDALSGVPVTITSNSFLVGLTRGEAEAHNVEAMRSRGWFDLPMVLEDGKPAKITFEKGASGDHILADALAAWGKS